MRTLLIFIILVLSAATSGAQQHPSIFLTPPTLNRLKAKVQARDPSWSALRAKCDTYIGGGVNFPDGRDYPHPPDIGSGYQGSDYYEHVVEQGLCYQVTNQVEPAKAARYGKKLVDILMKMSDPVHQVKTPPTGNAIQVADSGYGIRNYGVAMAIGYDWAHDLMTPAQRQQVYTALNVWVDLWKEGWVAAVISGGSVERVKVNVNPAYYFRSTPSVSFSGCGGSGATATATLTSGYVSAITVTSGGSGYTCAPTIYFNGSSYESRLWEAAHPLSNYFAGYYATEVLTALATAGENPKAADYWAHWSAVTHGTRVGPWLSTYLKGGGWPEGEADYGPLATRHYNWVAIPVHDIKGVDLVRAALPYSWGVDNVDYLMYFTWPNQHQYFAEDDVHNKGNTAVNYAHPDLFALTYFLGKYWNHPHLPQFHRFTKEVMRSVKAAWGIEAPAWQQFLFWDENDADADYRTLPLSHKLDGIQRVAARSDWTTSAVWWAFNASPYIDSPGQGEQFYGTGEFEIVRGGVPFIVLPGVWMSNISSAGERRMLDNLYRVSPRKRSWFNIFYVPSNTLDAGQWSGSSAIPALPPGESDKIGGAARTGLSAYEDGAGYVLATADHLEDMYRTWNPPECGPVTMWTRQLVYLRATNQLVVYDRTGICNPAYPQYLAFHTLAKPAVVAQTPAVAGSTRLDVTYKSRFAGAMISVLPAGAVVTSGDLETPPSNAVWRTTMAPSVAQTTNRWLTVFDMNASPAAVWQASPFMTDANTMVGVLLKAPSGQVSNVVLGNARQPGTLVSASISYSIPAGASRHVLTELPARSRYDILLTASGSRTVRITPNASGAFSTSSSGVLAFTVTADGRVVP